MLIKKLQFPSYSKTLCVLWLAHLVMDFFTGIWPVYKTIAQIDLAKAGLLAGISGFLGEIMQLFFGIASDRGHRKKILVLGLLLASSILWITLTSGLISSFCLLLLLMLGSGSFHPAAVGFAGSLSEGKKAKTILLFSSGGAVGLAMSQLIFTKIYYSFSGHATILFIPVVLVVIVVAMHRFPGHTSQPTSSWLKDFTSTIRGSFRALALLYLAQVTSYAVSLAFLFLLPDLIAAKTNNSWMIYGGAHLCYILGAAAALPLAASVCQRLGIRKALLIIVSGSCLLFYTLLSMSSPTAVHAGFVLVLLGGFLQSINPIIVTWGHKIVPEKPSTISALLMGFAWCFTSFGPTCAGFMCTQFEQGAIVKTLAVMGAFLFITLLLVKAMPKETLTSHTQELQTP